jgi:hypothetical protein
MSTVADSFGISRRRPEALRHRQPARGAAPARRGLLRRRDALPRPGRPHRGRLDLRLDRPALRALPSKHLTSNSMQALKAARLTSAELDWVVPQQGSVNIVKSISGRIGFPLGKLVRETEEHGNTLATSVPITHDRAVRARWIEPGQTVLMCALGAGRPGGDDGVAVARVCRPRRELVDPGYECAARSLRRSDPRYRTTPAGCSPASGPGSARCVCSARSRAARRTRTPTSTCSWWSTG